jgi:hypothetical protein
MPCDVFISYSHADEAFPSGWVSELHSRLDAAIRAAAPQTRVEIARDALDIRRSEDFNERIRTLLGEACVLICVMSPNFTHSSYCSAELEFFVQRGSMRRLKIMKVVKTFVQVSRQPDAVQNLLGHKFYGEDRVTFPAIIDNGRPHPRFEQAVGALASEVLQAVEAGRTKAEPILVLASADREAEAKAIVQDLDMEGISVVSGAKLPNARKGRRDALKGYVEQVNFSLLLIGNEYSEDLVNTFDHLEAKWRDAKVRRCLCATLSAASQPSDERQRKFLEQVRNSPESFDVVEGSCDVLPETIRLYKALVEQANQVPTVYLTYPKASRRRADTLRNEIRAAHESLGTNVPIRLLDPYGDGDSPTTRTQTFARDAALRHAHGAVVLIEDDGHYAQNVVGEIEDELSNPATPYIGIYPGGPKAKVAPSLARKHHVIVPDGTTGFDWLTRDAVITPLSKFLRGVLARATSA